MFVYHPLFELSHSRLEHYSRFHLLRELCISATIHTAICTIIISLEWHSLSLLDVTALSILTNRCHWTEAQVTHSESYLKIFASEIWHCRSNQRPRDHHSQSWRLLPPRRSWAVLYEENNLNFYCINALEERVEIEFWSDVILRGENSYKLLAIALRRNVSNRWLSLHNN